MTDYAQYSFWLDHCGEPLTPRPALAHSEEVDVAILGGGYTGLWTAYYLLRQSPDLKVAIVEKEIVGYGASGRNGGWCSSRFPVTPRTLAQRFGEKAARQTVLSIADSIDEIARICEEEEIDAHFRKSGILSLARGAHQLSAIQGTYAAYKSLGLEAQHHLLTPQEVADRVNVTNVYGGLFSEAGASLHPARLVRGLARAIERRGGIIYEQTEVTDFCSGGFKGCPNPGSGPFLTTPAGELRARHAIVLAGEAYLTRLPKLHRTLIPVYSLISITEPLSAAQWSQIGWQNGESLASNKYSVDYLTKTADGRILFGSRGAPYQFDSSISDDQDRHAGTHARIQKSLVEWFPSLEGIRFTHAWGGPVGMPRDWMPTVAFNPATKIATARGYTGQGVSTANLAARILAGQILENPSSLDALPMAHHHSPQWEIEPLRWLAVRYTQNAFLRIDEAAEKEKGAPLDAPIARFLGKH
jgi:glycine/D-amino acid oxidase-like deaminating enzyme